MSMEFSEYLFQPLEKASIGWIALSAIVGGGIGALIKLSLGTIAPERYKTRRLATQQFNKFKLPLLKSADSLDRRLSNMVRNIDKSWYDDESEDYYRVSTLYLFGQFFGWCKLVEDSEIFSLEVPTKSMSKFIHRFYTVFKSMTGFYYFKDAAEDEIKGERSAVYRFALTAIGELMIDSTDEHGVPKILGFVEFNKRINSDPDFVKWFGYLEKSILTKQNENIGSERWNRFLVIHYILTGFVSCLDPKNIHTSNRKIEFPKSLDRNVMNLINRDLDKMGFQGEVVHAS